RQSRMIIKTGFYIIVVGILPHIQTDESEQAAQYFHRRQSRLTMKTGFYILAVGILPHIQTVYASLEETVWLKDVTKDFQTDKRTLNDHELPDGLTFRLKRVTDALTLNLKRNYDINPNANVYLTPTLKDGQSVLFNTQEYIRIRFEDVAYYQDKEYGAFMTVRCVKRYNEQCERVINGNIRIGESTYRLRPAETDFSSGNMFDFQGRMAKRYFLHDLGQIQKENIVENTDTAQFKEKRLEEKLIDILSRIEGQYKQNQFSPSDSTSSSRNASGLHNRRETDKSRQLKKVYHVKAAVLIEPGIVDIYKKLLHGKSTLTTLSQVKKKIKESFSHVMAGVNLRYKGIEDPNISINVILSDFIFFPQTFKPTSTVTIINGTKYIDAKSYYSDLSEWDKSYGRNYIRCFDHGILFTSFRLKADDPNNPDVRGISLNGGICDVGDRLSIIETGDFVWMTWAAAHELGHNLGSWHDGEEDSAACMAEDYFVMTPQAPKVDPTKPYTRNPYIFSKCSVESFKKTLKEKQCVTQPCKLYKEEEYKEFVKVQPGEVYTPDDQCFLIMGAKSNLCQPDPANICQLMRCTDPKTGICMEEHFDAASGTSCGPDKWCFEGRCVKAAKKSESSLPQ
ncbi:hypothetical protein CHS0354_001069, partial [Potamilus streckersoni]